MSRNGPRVYNLTFLSAAAKYLARSNVSGFVLAYSLGRDGHCVWEGMVERVWICSKEAGVQEVAPGYGTSKPAPH